MAKIKIKNTVSRLACLSVPDPRVRISAWVQVYLQTLAHSLIIAPIIIYAHPEYDTFVVTYGRTGVGKLN